MVHSFYAIVLKGEKRRRRDSALGFIRFRPLVGLPRKEERKGRLIIRPRLKRGEKGVLQRDDRLAITLRVRTEREENRKRRAFYDLEKKRGTLHVVFPLAFRPRLNKRRE